MRKITSFFMFVLTVGSSFTALAQSGPSIIEVGKIDVNAKLAPPITVNNIVKSSNPNAGEWTSITVRFRVKGVAKKQMLWMMELG